MNCKRLVPILLALVLCLIPLRCFAQNAEISGTVRDASGAAIPSASVTIRNSSTGVAKKTLSSPSGFYHFELAPSLYDLTVGASGFKQLQRTGVTLDVGQKAQLDLLMSVGSASETIAVSSGTEELQTSSAFVGNLITTAELARLPVNGRNYTHLITLSPGVGNVTTSQTDGTVSGTALYSVNGQREQDNNYTIDGIENNFFHDNAPGASPAQDAIAEFRVATGNSAEYGRSIGAAVSILTRSGANNFHGTLYEYLRNSDFDANNYFAKAAGKSRPPYHQNQYGVAVGGPLTVPKLYSGRDRLFFFFSFEGFRSAQGNTLISTVPTAAERTGDFSALSQTIYNPYTTVSNAQGNIRQPFAVRNVIPTALLDPASQYILNNLIPLPNLPGISNNYINTQSTVNNRTEYVGRLDYNISAKNLIFFRALSQSVEQRAANADAYLTGVTRFDIANYGGGWTAALSPKAVLDVRVGYHYPQGPSVTANTVGLTRNTVLQQAGINIFQPNTPYNSIPTITATGDFSVAEGGGTSRDHVLEFNAIYSRQLGSSNLKVGLEVQPRQYYHDANSPDNGVATYAKSITNTATDPASGSSTASFLLGFPSTIAKGSGGSGVDARQIYYAAFTQYDWRATQSLTVNVGLRYEFFLPVYDIHDQLGGLWIHPNSAGAIIGTQIWAGTNPLTGAGPNQAGFGRGLEVTDYNNFAPRIGLEYRVGSKTVVRSGFGVYYDSTFFQESQDKRKSYPYNYAQNLTVNSTGVPTVNLATSASTQAASLGGFLNQPGNRTPYSYQYNFFIERELPGKVIAQAGYVGSQNRKQIGYVDANTAITPGPGAVTPRRLLYLSGDPISQQYGDLQLGINGYNSNYNALQLQATRRYSNGLEFNVNYTYGKVLDYESSLSETKDQNPYNQAADYSRASYDLTHIANISFVYDLPYGRGRRFGAQAPRVLDALAGGWSLESITRLETGPPVNPVLGQDRANVGVTVQRPNCSGDPNAGPKTASRWFNVGAFSTPATYTYGTCGAFIIQSPGERSVDMALYKRFALFKSQTLDFRAELFNIPNTTNFAPPNGNYSSSSFGTITSLSLQPRQIQLALRYSF